MKRTFLCLLLALAATAPAMAEHPRATEITVTGRGAVALAPNVAIVSAAVQSNAATAAQALSSNNAAYDRIVDAVTKLGVARDDIALTSYNVSYTAPRQGPDNGDRTGYTVSREFSIRVRSTARAGDVTDACIDAGATSINGVQFTLADNAAARAQAIALAVADARKNADLLAHDAGLRIVGIGKVALDEAGYYQPNFRMIANVSARTTAFDQGNVEVSASVNVTFLAQPSP